MFGIGGFELFLILLFGFLIFGPDKLPGIAKTVGQAIAKFRQAQEDMSGTLKNEVFNKDADEPFKNPFDVIDDAAAKAKKGADEAKKTAKVVSQKAESFSERKARYDRERAARKAEEKAASEAAAKKAAQAASADPLPDTAAKTVGEASDAAASAATATTAETAAASASTEEKGD